MNKPCVFHRRLGRGVCDSPQDQRRRVKRSGRWKPQFEEEGHRDLSSGHSRPGACVLPSLWLETGSGTRAGGEEEREGDRGQLKERRRWQQEKSLRHWQRFNCVRVNEIQSSVIGSLSPNLTYFRMYFSSSSSSIWGLGYCRCINTAVCVLRCYS